jgi:DNA-binding GntR family transcriptional regulator
MTNDGVHRSATRTSLAEEAYEAIRRMILDGRLTPGSRVTVRPIASALDLSPTPIKAAFVRLEREGVLESRLHRGFFVPTLSRQDMHDIYEMREGLDCVAVRRAVRAPQRSKIAAILRRSCERQQVSLQKSDIDGYRAEDLLFHQMLWMLSGNDRVRRAGESLQDQMRLGNAVSSRRPGRAAQSVVEHLAIVDAILVGDADAAEKAARRHIQLTAENFDEELGSGEPADPKGFELDKVGTVTGSTNPAKLTIQ